MTAANMPIRPVAAEDRVSDGRGFEEGRGWWILTRIGARAALFAGLLAAAATATTDMNVTPT